ncbi:MAG: SpoIIE family protein phosphatase [Myxococcales bacterium]|nr:SpoIIE family protein phosphatase [Myxococcales bacterium]
MPVALSFHLTALPFLALAVGLAALALVPALVRGEVVVRLGFTMIGLCALPWAATTALGACVDDGPSLLPFMRAAFAPIPLVGSGLLIVMLGVAGRIEGHRRIVVASVVINATLMVVCAASSTVVASIAPTGWGLPYPRAGYLYGLFVTSIPACVAYGAWATRGASVDRLVRATSRKAVLGVGVLAVLAISDIFLTYGVFGVYPVSWLPRLIAVGLSLYAIFAGDVLNQRGVDRAAVIEAGVAIAGAAAVMVLAMAIRTPAILAVVTAGYAAAMVAIGRTLAMAAPPPQARDKKVVALRDAIDLAEHDDELAATASELLAAAGLLVHVRVWFGTGDLRPAAGGRGATPLAVPAEIRAFLVQQARPLPIGDLVTERLGPLRPTMMAWVAELGADVVVPLCERDALVGLLVGDLPGDRAMRDSERVQLEDLARAIARAHTVHSLRRDIEARTELAREVELADVVRQARASGGRRTLAGIDVAVAYHPAPRVAGDLWFAGELADGRGFVLVGDVAGRGTPAALVSAAVIGACQSAIGLAEPTATPLGVLTLLHGVVRAIDNGRHRVTAAALLIERATADAPARVTMALAGHRGGYLTRPRGDDVELVPLVGRGAPLGEPDWRASEASHTLAPGDAVVVVSDGVVAACNRDGAAWGERRLQRTLRELVGRAGDVADGTLAAVDGHIGDARLDDDVLIVAVTP